MATPGTLARLGALDLYLCRRLNRLGSRAILHVFAAVSRLADGGAWLALVIFLCLAYGAAGRATSGHLLAVAAVGLPVYKLLKRLTARPRPCAAHDSVVALGAPLDRYSFPSGHTLHAVAFTAVAAGRHPPLAWLLIPFALLVGLSRVALGLHYPSDVLAGAAIGAALAGLAWL